jgi:hypothetical protein
MKTSAVFAQGLVASGLAWLMASPASLAEGLLTPLAERSGEAALAWSSKQTCGTTEHGVTRYGMWEGKLYSRIPGEKDRHLFNVVGINTRQCARLSDPVRGSGYRSVSREIMVYLDPATGEIAEDGVALVSPRPIRSVEQLPELVAMPTPAARPSRLRLQIKVLPAVGEPATAPAV